MYYAYIIQSIAHPERTNAGFSADLGSFSNLGRGDII